MVKTSVTLFLDACSEIDSFKFRDDVLDFVNALFKNKKEINGLYHINESDLDIFPFNDDEKEIVIDFIKNAKKIPKDDFDVLLQSGLLF